MYFLAIAQIVETPYQGDSKQYQIMQLVKADGPDEADEKFKMHWYKKSESYCVEYTVADLIISETIT